jgi:hypothetical protein
MVHACDPSYTGDISRRIKVTWWAWAKSARIYLKNNKSKKGQALFGSSGRAAAYNV